MKVFEFNPVTGRPGPQVTDILVPQFLSNPRAAKCKLPKDGPDTNWTIATVALDRNNERVAFDRPVCFCIGKLTAGTDTAWHWFALLPEN
jgi:hypothetical protein